MTDVERTKIDAALERYDGNGVQAAAIIGIGHRELKKLIQSDTDLRRKWVEQRVATDAEALSRAVMKVPEPPASEDAHLAEVLQAEDAAFRQRLAKLDFKGQELDLLMNVQALADKQFRNSLEFCQGGLTYINTKCLLERDRLEAEEKRVLERLGDHEKYPPASDDRAKIVAELVDWNRMLRACDQQVANNAEKVQHGSLTQALMRKHRKQTLKPKTAVS